MRGQLQEKEGKLLLMSQDRERGLHSILPIDVVHLLEQKLTSKDADIAQLTAQVAELTVEKQLQINQLEALSSQLEDSRQLISTIRADFQNQIEELRRQFATRDNLIEGFQRHISELQVILFLNKKKKETKILQKKNYRRMI